MCGNEESLRIHSHPTFSLISFSHIFLPIFHYIFCHITYDIIDLSLFSSHLFKVEVEKSGNHNIIHEEKTGEVDIEL